ncbi:MAG: hypothetical protein GX338_02735 [Firmicutes bacterium]|jgi:hypothetical protein|nr:hypothetical protein [Bacillota bacterium]
MELSKEFRERFIKTLQGRDYVLYGGLLELARQRGLKRISTKVIQIPSMDNGMYGVVEAEIETEDGLFTEVGDASPDSVNRAIQPHLLRMAATRAKARAMRDAVGIDMVALEELGDTLLSDETTVPDNPEDLILTFGKYVRKSLGQVVRQDPGYVAWLAENARDEGVKQAARNVLEQQAQVEPGDFPEVRIERPPAH